jgi:aspartate/methionine/tyrosine aminotransferase
MFRDCIDADQEAEEARFLDAFFGMAGQSSISALPRPSFHYSASVSIAIAAAHLRALGGVVLVVHPTFDNIPALLSRHGVPMRPIAFSEVNALDTFPEDVKALVLVIPNNPTGESVDTHQLDRIARVCADQNVELVIDFSFRFASDLCEWDQYAVLQDSKARFLCIEDTGKTWPVLDLKVGLMVSSAALVSSVRAITEDYILNVSPFLLRLLTEYIKSDPDRSWRAIAQANRDALEAALEGSPATVRDDGAAETIAWVYLGDGWDGDEFCRWANSEGVAVCPGGPFYWDRPEAGQEFIRVALLRPHEYFQRAVGHLRSLIDSYSPGTFLRLQAADVALADA